MENWSVQSLLDGWIVQLPSQLGARRRILLGSHPLSPARLLSEWGGDNWRIDEAFGEDGDPLIATTADEAIDAAKSCHRLLVRLAVLPQESNAASARLEAQRHGECSSVQCFER
jgi:hypothetical protein